MAVATTTARETRREPLWGYLTVKLASMTGVTLGMPLLLDGDVGLTALQFLPNNCLRCMITSVPRGKGKLIFQAGKTVSG